MKKNRKKKNVVLYILLIIACLGIGYAYLTTTLNINGTTDVDSNSWNVYWENINVMQGSISGSQVIQAPVVDNTGTSVSFSINLKQPGEYYEFTIDAKNDGSLDAMIGSFSKKLNGVEITTLPAYLEYSVMYADGLEIEENHILAVGTIERYKIKVGVKKDLTISELPSTSQNLNLSFAVDYSQADSNAIRVRNALYLTPLTTLSFGSRIPSELQVFGTYEGAMNASEHDIFIKVTLDDNSLVNASYVGFVYNNNVYYLRGGGATFNPATDYYNQDGIYYEENKALLISIFGIDGCEESTGDHVTIQCQDGEIGTCAAKSGYVYATDSYLSGNSTCFAQEDGSSICEDM